MISSQPILYSFRALFYLLINGLFVFLNSETLVSDKLKNKIFSAQQVEAYLRVGALNKMTGLGVPESYPVS